MKRKIVIDTNVIVSSLIQLSYPYKIIHDQFLEDKFQLCMSKQLLMEYFEVLSRPKFAQFTDFFVRAESLLLKIEEKAMYYTPSLKLEIIDDNDDNKILELADASNADVIITGNTKDFTISHYKSTRILTPKQYWDDFGE